MSELSESDAHQIFKIWAEALSNTLGQVSGHPLPCEVRPGPSAELSSPAEHDLWFLGVLAGSLRGEFTLRLPVSTAIPLARIFAEVPEPATPKLTEEHREAIAELFRQVGGIVASTLRQSNGDVQIRVEIVPSAPTWQASAVAALRAGTDPSPYWMQMQISAALATSLRAKPTEEKPTQKSETESATESARNVNLELLMDVELDVSLRFGSRRLSLREILDLSQGSVIELNRQVQQPVDLLLDRRVVARGEVVVIQGNFGLRVTQLVPCN